MTSVYPFNAYINGSTKQNKIPFHHLNGQINNYAPLFLQPEIQQMRDAKFV